MSKYCGFIGFSITVEADGQPGVDIPKLIERKYYGDVIDDIRRWDPGEKINSDFNITNRISVLIDSFASQNLGAIKCATFMGTRWNVKSVSVSHPRMILTLGGVYNGPIPSEEAS